MSQQCHTSLKMQQHEKWIFIYTAFSATQTNKQTRKTSLDGPEPGSSAVSSNICGEGEQKMFLYVPAKEPYQILFHLANLLVFSCEKYRKTCVGLDGFESRATETGGKK